MRIFPIRAARPPRPVARSFGCFSGARRVRGGREGPLHHPGNPKGKSAKLEMSEARPAGRAEAADEGGRRNITLEDGKGASFANFNAQA